MNTAAFIKKLLFASLGLLIMGFGCGMLVKTGWGADTSNALYTGIASHTRFTVGQINMFGNVVFVILVFLIEKKYLGIAMIPAVLLIRYPVDFAIAVLPSAENLISAVILDILALFITAIGASMMIEAGLGCGPYDAFVLAVSERFRIRFLYVKYAADGFCILSGLLLKGEVGIGTLLCFLLIGLFIDRSRKLMKTLMERVRI